MLVFLITYQIKWRENQEINCKSILVPTIVSKSMGYRLTIEISHLSVSYEGVDCM